MLGSAASVLFALRQLGSDAGFEQTNFRQLRFSFIEQSRQAAIFRYENMAQQVAQFFAIDAVTPCLGSLPAQTINLAIDFGNDVRDARKIAARIFESSLRGALAHTEFRDTGRLFNDRAAIHRLSRKNLADASLLDDCVMAAREPRPRKQILNVAQAAKAIIQQVLAFARAVKPPTNRNGFSRLKLKCQVPPAPMSFVGFRGRRCFWFCGGASELGESVNSS